jgi:hypothetical protein
MDKKHLYSISYRRLQDSTPLRLDCGTLCNKACCEGDENTGMYLFPGEEIMYQANPDFLTIKPAHIDSCEDRPVLLGVCSGVCDRNFRPLSCRIFPLAPYINDKDTLTLKFDPRAKNLCPICFDSNLKRLDQLFVKNVREVFRMLIEDKEVKAFVLQLSRMLDAYVELQSTLLK